MTKNTKTFDLEERTAKFGESKHFLRMFAKTNSELTNEIRNLWQEARELHLIFNTIYRKVK